MTKNTSPANDLLPIQMVDLAQQYLTIKPAMDQAIQACIDATAFINGPQVAIFEKQLASYLPVERVVCCANGTDALQIAMMALGLRPGDEVIMPAFNYISVMEVTALLGLTPVLVDVDPHTFNLDPEQVVRAITPRTRLIVPVHLFGQCADMQALVAVCQARQIYLVEDAAQAIGAQVTLANGTTAAAGTMGDLGTTSFFPSKNLGCFGDGGAVLTSNPDLAQRARMITTHGQRQKYHHEIVGINSRLDTLQAAILTEKLKHLPAYTQARQQAAARYDEQLRNVSGVAIPYRSSHSTHVFHQYTLKVPASQRDGLKDYLRQKGIPSMVYYPIPVPAQKAYESVGRVVGDLATTRELCQRVLSLPMHTELSDDQLDYIGDAVISYFR